MKKSRFSEQQIAFALRQAEEGTAVAEVCRKAGISEAFMRVGPWVICYTCRPNSSATIQHAKGRYHA